MTPLVHNSLWATDAIPHISFYPAHMYIYAHVTTPVLCLCLKERAASVVLTREKAGTDKLKVEGE